MRTAEANREMERSVDVVTGESVAFSYDLAGLGSRFLAVFIDTLVQTCVAIGLFVVVGTVGPRVAWLPLFGRSKILSSIAFAALVLIAFLLFFGYFIAFETLWNGRTPGKRIVGIRVVRDGGFPVDFSSALIRNVVRILEAGLGFYAISAISALASPQNRRLGDYAAGTIVVRDEAIAEGAPAARAAADGAVDDPLVHDLGSRERDLVLRYAMRRETLRAAARAALAAHIADVVRPHLAARFDHLDDDALLTHVAEALR